MRTEFNTAFSPLKAKHPESSSSSNLTGISMMNHTFFFTSYFSSNLLLISINIVAMFFFFNINTTTDIISITSKHLRRKSMFRNRQLFRPHCTKMQKLYPTCIMIPNIHHRRTEEGKQQRKSGPIVQVC